MQVPGAKRSRTSLVGRRVVVTGASRGIGRQVAGHLSAAGARVVLVARASDALEQAAAETGGEAAPCDLADPAARSRLIGEVESSGPVDVLVNNAGISNVGHFLDTDPDDIERLVQVDLLAPMQLCRGWLPGMLERGHGHLVNVSSLAAVMSPPGLASYAAAKAGLSAFTAGLRQDLRDLPVGLTCVHLGSVPTELDDASREYGPLREAAAASKGRDLTPLPVVADAIVEAIRTGRAEVRLPRSLAPLPALAEAPRAVTRAIFRRYAVGPSGGQG
jgi:short-subunit dehydrogenase